MKKSLSPKLSALLVSTTMLASCGGGTSSEQVATTTTTPTTTTPTLTAATFGDCFKLTPGVKFTRSNGSKILNVLEQFEGQTAASDMELRANDTRFGGPYFSVDSTYIQILGINQYDINGVFKGKDVFSSGNRLSVNMTPGQTSQVSYTQTSTRLNPASTTTTSVTDQLTFVGFENLTLGGKTFTNVCKTKSPAPGSTTGETSVAWFANGFGVIQNEKKDAQGNQVAGSRIQLATIVTAP